MSFRRLLVLARGRLIPYIYICHLFAGTVYHIVFSPVCRLAGVSSLEMIYDIFRNGDEGTWQKHLEYYP